MKITTYGNQEYNKLKENPVALSNHFDVVYYDGTFLVFDPKNFEKIFDYFRIYKEDADRVFENLDKSNINISRYNEVKKSIWNNENALRRMRRIRKNGKYQNLTRESVEELISEWGLDVYVGTSDGGEWQIQIEDLRKIGDILKLLDDDLAVSGIDIVSDAKKEEKYIVQGGKEIRE